jgi:hypothetical protein
MMAETISDLNLLPTDEEMYDGPAPGNVHAFPGSEPLQIIPVNLPFETPPSNPGAPPVSKAKYVEIVNAALGILGARLLGLIAVIGAVVMFGLAVWDPMPWRTYTVAAYAAVVLWPIVWLYLRRG